jgi:hypothetical protein
VHVLVVYRAQDRDVGGRLHDDLAARLGAGHVSRNAAATDPDALVVVIGPGWAQAPEPRAVAAVEHALASETTVVPVVVDPAPMPRADELPASIAGLAALEPVAASSEYWAATIDRVQRAIPPPRRHGLARVVALVRRRPRWSIAGLIGAVTGVVGVLHAIGVINPPPETHALGLPGPAGGEITFDRYLRKHRDEHVTRGDYPLRPDLEGVVYRVEVSLENARHEHYSLRTNLKDAETDNPPEGIRPAFVGARFSPAEAGRIHYVWVPCVPNDLEFYAEFELVDDATAARLESRASPKKETCRDVEP